MSSIYELRVDLCRRSTAGSIGTLRNGRSQMQTVEWGRLFHSSVSAFITSNTTTSSTNLCPFLIREELPVSFFEFFFLSLFPLYSPQLLRIECSTGGQPHFGWPQTLKTEIAVCPRPVWNQRRVLGNTDKTSILTRSSRYSYTHKKFLLNLPTISANFESLSSIY